MGAKKPNAFLAKQEQEKRKCFKIGMDTAWQEFWDMLCIVLHDPEVMGKDTFGKERLLRIREAIAQREDQMYHALSTGPEADYYQEKLDAMLREIFGENLAPFKDRYPHIRQLDYTKQHKEWK